MANADSVKAKLQSLITKANETTGNTDEDLTTAVNALVAGFGQGGGGDSLSVITGTFSVSADNGSYRLTDSRFAGKTVLLITYYCPELDATPQNTCIIGGWVCGSNVYGMSLYNLTYNTGNGNTTKTYAYSTVIADNNTAENEFALGSNNRKFLAGYTYQWTAYAM